MHKGSTVEEWPLPRFAGTIVYSRNQLTLSSHSKIDHVCDRRLRRETLPEVLSEARNVYLSESVVAISLMRPWHARPKRRSGKRRPQPAAQLRAPLSNLHVVFVWDETKDRFNRRNHGASFGTAAGIFGNPDVAPCRDRMVDEGDRCRVICRTTGPQSALPIRTSGTERAAASQALGLKTRLLHDPVRSHRAVMTPPDPF